MLLLEYELWRPGRSDEEEERDDDDDDISDDADWVLIPCKFQSAQ